MREGLLRWRPESCSRNQCRQARKYGAHAMEMLRPAGFGEEQGHGCAQHCKRGRTPHMQKARRQQTANEREDVREQVNEHNLDRQYQADLLDEIRLMQKVLVGLGCGKCRGFNLHTSRNHLQVRSGEEWINSKFLL
jgi:hypothetical protein